MKNCLSLLIWYKEIHNVWLSSYKTTKDKIHSYISIENNSPKPEYKICTGYSPCNVYLNLNCYLKDI